MPQMKAALLIERPVGTIDRIGSAMAATETGAGA